MKKLAMFFSLFSIIGYFLFVNAVSSYAYDAYYANKSLDIPYGQTVSEEDARFTYDNSFDLSLPSSNTQPIGTSGLSLVTNNYEKFKVEGVASGLGEHKLTMAPMTMLAPNDPSLPVGTQLVDLVYTVEAKVYLPYIINCVDENGSMLKTYEDKWVDVPNEIVATPSNAAYVIKQAQSAYNNTQV